MFLVIYFSVKCSLEQATIQRLHFSKFLPVGFGNGINTFSPDSFNSLGDFGHLSGYLESVLHSPQPQCLVPIQFNSIQFYLTGTNHSLSFLKLTLQFDEVFRSFPSIRHFTLIHFFVAVRNVCLSLCWGSHVAKSIFSNSAKRYLSKHVITCQSGKFAVLRRQRKRKSGETLPWPATGIPRNYQTPNTGKVTPGNKSKLKHFCFSKPIGKRNMPQGWLQR